MTSWMLERLASEHLRQRSLDAERERLAASLRTHRVRRNVAGRAAATLGQLLAAHREAAAR